MPVSREQILEAAKLMTPEQRYDLIEDVRQILDDDEFDASQIAEIRRRIEASDRGEGESRPAEEVVVDLREKLRKRRRRRAS